MEQVGEAERTAKRRRRLRGRTGGPSMRRCLLCPLSPPAQSSLVNLLGCPSAALPARSPPHWPVQPDCAALLSLLSLRAEPRHGRQPQPKPQPLRPAGSLGLRKAARMLSPASNTTFDSPLHVVLIGQRGHSCRWSEGGARQRRRLGRGLKLRESDLSTRVTG